MIPEDFNPAEDLRAMRNAVKKRDAENAKLKKEVEYLETRHIKNVNKIFKLEEFIDRIED